MREFRQGSCQRPVPSPDHAPLLSLPEVLGMAPRPNFPFDLNYLRRVEYISPLRLPILQLLPLSSHTYMNSLSHLQRQLRLSSTRLVRFPTSTPSSSYRSRNFSATTAAMGVSKTVLSEGSGAAPKVGDTVTIEYTGFIKDTSKPDNKGSQ